MKFVALVFAIAVLPVLECSAQNASSKKLLAMSEVQRNASWTRALQHHRCNDVAKSEYQASARSRDEWNVLCNNKIDYSILLPDNPKHQVKVVSCNVLKAIARTADARSGKKPRKFEPCWHSVKDQTPPAQVQKEGQ